MPTHGPLIYGSANPAVLARVPGGVRRVLDVGCGDGTLGAELRRRGVPEVWGITHSADEAVREVIETGEPQRLEPMDSIERRLVHQRVASHGGVVSNSHGREPARRIVIELADD